MHSHLGVTPPIFEKVSYSLNILNFKRRIWDIFFTKGVHPSSHTHKSHILFFLLNSNKEFFVLITLVKDNKSYKRI